MALSSTVFDIFYFEKYYDLEIRVEITQGHRSLYHLISCLWFSISVL